MRTKEVFQKFRTAAGAMVLSSLVCTGTIRAQTPPANGLQIYWPLDETAGLTASDASGNNMAGSLVGYPEGDGHWIPGKKGNALNFTGSSHVEALGFSEMSSTTWAAWVKLNATPNNSAVISSTFAGATAGHSLGFGSGADALKPRVVWNHNVGSTILLSPTAVALNEWNHVALTYDAATTSLKLYLNGQEKIASATAASNPFTSINLGRRQASANTWINAGIDEAVVYNRALELSEIQALAGLVTSGPPVITQQPLPRDVVEGSRVQFSVKAGGKEPLSYQWQRNGQNITGATEASYVIDEASRADAGTFAVVVTNSEGSKTSDPVQLTVTTINLANGLKAHWKFDESTGLTASDSTANGNHGVLNNFADETSGWVPGEINGAIAFDGSNYVEVPDHSSIGADLVNGFTVSTWFRSNIPLPATGGTRTSRMLEKGDGFFFLQNPGTGGMNFLVKRNNGNFTANLMDSIEPNRWYHIAGTFDGNSISLFLDGQLKGTTTVGGPMDDDKLPLRIGSDDAGAFFNGAMDELQIWNRPLNRREILNVMGRDLPEPPSFKVQPAPITRYAGSTAVFSVDARGKEPFRYLWYKGNEEIRSATGPVLTIPDVTISDAGDYRVKVSNELGETFSQTATLTVLPVLNVGTGLAAQWKFEETTGLVAADSSTGNRPADLVDFPDETSHWTAGKVNGALNFDGVQSRAIVQNGATLNLPGEATFAFWINPVTYGTEQSAGTYNFSEGRILRKAGHFDIFAVDNPGGVRRTIIAGGVNAPQGSLELNSWQHFTVVFKAGMAQFYKNGFPIGEPKVAALGAGNDLPLVIGNFDDTATVLRSFNGQMDEVSIWERPLGESEILEIAGKDVAGAPVIEVQPQPLTRIEGGTAQLSVIATGKRPVSYQWFKGESEIAGATSSTLSFERLTLADAGNYKVRVRNEVGEQFSASAALVVESLDHITSGLIGYWTFDETSGTTLNDSSGKGHHGTLNNFNAAPGINGVVGGAFDFDGTGAFVVVPHKDTLNVVGEGSISAWINPRAHGTIGGLGRIVRKSVNYDLTTTVDRGGTLLFYGENKAAYYAQTNAVELNTWQHVGIVLKDGLVQFYKNGKALGAPIPGRLGEINGDPLVIANFQADLAITRLFSGLMDELGIWSRALSPADMDGIYQNGLLGKPLNATFEPLRINSISATGQVRLNFYSPYAGRQYSIQGKNLLEDAVWSDVANVQITPAGQNLFDANFALPSSGTAFYQVMVQPLPPLFEEGFETGGPGWTHGGAEDNWEVGVPTTGPGQAHGGQNVYATGLSSNYREFTDSWLQSPVIDLRNVNRATLNFWEWRNTDIDPLFHGTVVNVLDADSLALLQELSRTAGPSGGWQERNLRLGPNTLGKRIIIEFRLYSDHTNLREGWFLDDIRILPE